MLRSAGAAEAAADAAAVGGNWESSLAAAAEAGCGGSDVGGGGASVSLVVRARSLPLRPTLGLDGLARASGYPSLASTSCIFLSIMARIPSRA